MEMGFVSMVEPVLRCRSFFWGPTPGPDSRLKDFVRTQEPQKQKIRKDGSGSGSVSVPAQAPAACTATLGMTSNQRSRVRIPNILPNPTECVYSIYTYISCLLYKKCLQSHDAIKTKQKIVNIL